MDLNFLIDLFIYVNIELNKFMKQSRIEKSYRYDN